MNNIEEAGLALVKLCEENEVLREQLSQNDALGNAVKQERDEAKQECSVAEQGRDAAKQECNIAVQERDAAKQECDELRLRLGRAEAEVAALHGTLDFVATQGAAVAEMEREIARLTGAVKMLRDEKRPGTDRMASIKLRLSVVWLLFCGGLRLPYHTLKGRMWDHMRKTRDAMLVLQSRLFDQEYYLRANPDVAEKGGDPFRHFMEYGGQEGRSPCSVFDSRWYLDQYPDVRDRRTNPLVHYIKAGSREGRQPFPGFDSRWYGLHYSDVGQSGTLPLTHYFLYGRFEGRFIQGV